MDRITWGVNGFGECVVLCGSCNAVFGKAQGGRALEIKYLAERSHVCPTDYPDLETPAESIGFRPKPLPTSTKD